MNKLFVEASPHIRSSRTTQNVMLDVVIALCPALIAATIIFGIKALVLTVICCASCVVFELLFNMIAKKERTISDMSAVVTGMLLAFNLPVDLPIYMAVIGCFIAIVIVKCLFGGIGQNFANPAITARIALMLSFTAAMTTWTAPLSAWDSSIDAATSATPLVADKLPSLMDMFLGVRAGCLGETCIAALLLGALYLLIRGVIRFETPLCFIGTVAVLTLFKNGFDCMDMLGQLMAGGLVLGAFFMATDYSTTPITTKGKIIFAVGCGVITFLIREFASLPEGVSFSILVMNCLTPLIDRVTVPKPLGALVPEKKKKEGENNG
ncbi:MAG: RnfABCDGE type electron transport complex subunit D [Oscillospiraceae bacterium]|nr:RnfABCDGE type electron transport complex subunit D [Oscillospiraceae bacterium]